MASEGIQEDHISNELRNVLLDSAGTISISTFENLATRTFIIINDILYQPVDTRDFSNYQATIVFNRWDASRGSNFGKPLTGTVTVNVPSPLEKLDRSNLVTDGELLYLVGGDDFTTTQGQAALDGKGIYAFDPVTGNRQTSKDISFTRPDPAKEVWILGLHYDTTSKCFYIHNGFEFGVVDWFKICSGETELTGVGSLDNADIRTSVFVYKNHLYPIKFGVPGSSIDYEAYDLNTIERREEADLSLVTDPEILPQSPGFDAIIIAVDRLYILWGTTPHTITEYNTVSDGGGEFTIPDNSITTGQLNTINTRAAFDVPAARNSVNDEFVWLSIPELLKDMPDDTIPHNKLVAATHYVDNGGSIDPREGDYNMALVFKKQTGVGSPNEEWVPANLDTIFELNSVQVGADDNPNRKHDYGLQFRPGAIQYTDINPIDDFDNLIGLNFIQNPAIVSNGNPLRPRLAKPWVREDDNLFPNSQFDTSDVKFTIPRTRTALTRGITHILVKAGRISGITDSSTRDDIITNGVDNPSNVYHEISLSLSAAYAKNNAAARRDGFDRYNLLFAAGVSCAVEVKSNEDGTLDIIAEVNNTGSALNGQEYIAFYAVRGAGG